MSSAQPSTLMDQPLRAFFWMALSALGFGSLSALVKSVAPLSHGLEIVFVRSFLNLGVALLMHRLAGETLFPKSGRKVLLVRALMGFGGITCFFYSLEHLPVSIAALLNWSSPVFIMILSRIFLKERLPPQSLLWMAVSFAGLILILNPWRSMTDVKLDPYAVMIGGLGALFVAGAYTALRAATTKMGANTIIVYFMAISSVLSLPFAIYERFYVRGGAFSSELILRWLAIAGCAALGQYSMTQGYRHAKAGVASTMGLMNAAVALFWGWLFFDEILTQTQWLGVLGLWLGIGFLVHVEQGFRAKL